jgi:hypothetical protein
MTMIETRGRVLGLTRFGVWVLFVLAAANAVFLYFLPARAKTDYAWPIIPPVNAAFIGAGFLAGTMATALALRTSRWRDFSLLPPALWVLATSLFAATMIHHDRFKFDYAPTWVWTFVYGVVPLAIPVLVYRQQKVAESLPQREWNVQRILNGVFGVGILIGAIALYVSPGLGEHWLWALTPLLARAVASWYALFGTMLLTFAIGMRDPREGLIGYATLLTWCVLLLLLPVLHPDDVSGGALWYVLMVALLVLSAFGIRRATHA